MRALAAIERLDPYELQLCRLFNQVENRTVLTIFRTVSWLGDWPIWPLLAVLILSVDGRGALPALQHWAPFSVVTLTVYKVLKNGLARERPCVKYDAISPLVPPFDRYSFPSGHTLHAFAFTPMLVHFYPVLIWLMVPYTILVAFSRVVLGVHYPSDVLAGATLGSLLATLPFVF